MKVFTRIIAVVFLLVSTLTLASQQYVQPPSSSTRGYVPVISDAQMEQCVKLYNEAKWIYKEIQAMSVDNYSQKSVDAYNRQVSKHSSLTQTFNVNCAGKQSRSACEATRKMNIEQGLPARSCS